MKVFSSIYPLSILIFITGLVLKLFRAPYHTIIMLVGLVVILIISVTYLIVKQKTKGLLGLTSFASGLYIVFLIKFWPYTLVLGLLLFIVLITIIIGKKAILNFPGRYATIGVLIVVGVLLNILPNHQRYYLFNIQYNHHLADDYWAWDKYSWFLNLADMNEEALGANKKAFSIVKNTDDSNMKDLILLHQQKLQAREWERYK